MVGEREAGALSGRSGELDHVGEALGKDLLDDLAEDVGDRLSNLGVDPVLDIDLGVSNVRSYWLANPVLTGL